MGDTELRDVADFGGLEILHGQIAAVPVNRPLLVARGDTRNHLEQGALAASGGADDGHKFTAGEFRGNIGKKPRGLLAGTKGQGKVF